MFSTNAMEGHQGDQRFWTTSVRWGELDHVLVFPDELGELDEDQRMQRGLAKGRLGALVQYLSGDVRLFPADGQHRAKAAMTAIREDPRLAREAVPVVLVPYQAPDQV